jgi:hypothetical protein
MWKLAVRLGTHFPILSIFSPMGEDQVSHPYQTTCTVIDLYVLILSRQFFVVQFVQNNRSQPEKNDSSSSRESAKKACIKRETDTVREMFEAEESNASLFDWDIEIESDIEKTTAVRLCEILV